MYHSIKLLAFVAATVASPYPVPEGVTSAIAPKESTLPRCSQNYPSKFGMTLVPVPVGQSKRGEPVSQIPDGQVQGPTAPANPTPESTITITCGTSNTSCSSITLSAPVSSGPETTMATTCELGDMTCSSSTPPSSAAPTPSDSTHTAYLCEGRPCPPVTQIGDGQPQGAYDKPQPPQSTGTELMPPKPTSDNPESSGASPVTQIGDGQPQAPTDQPQIAGRRVATQNNGVVVERATADACGVGAFVMSLKDGVLTDSHGRTGYIASNYQFQFDSPPQHGALITAGYSVCEDGSIAQGAQTVFYRCKSGNFYNIYDHMWAAQCEPVWMKAIPNHCS